MQLAFACALTTIFTEESWKLEWIRIRVDGHIWFEYVTCALSSAEASRGRAGDHGKGEESEAKLSSTFPEIPALIILFPSPPIYSLLSLTLHPPPPENPREPLRRRELRVDAQSFKLAKKIPDLKIFWDVWTKPENRLCEIQLCKLLNISIGHNLILL